VIVLELVITIADGARSNFTTPIGPALTVSSQLRQSRDLASCSVFASPCSRFSSAVRPTRHRREIISLSARVSTVTVTRSSPEVPAWRPTVDWSSLERRNGEAATFPARGCSSRPWP